MEQLREYATVHDTNQPWQHNNEALNFIRCIGEVCSYFGTRDMSCGLNLPDRAG